MFHCYVLRSLKTGRRYVGSCENLEARIECDSSGKVAATKPGIPWMMVHMEGFNTRRQAVSGELYYKTGRSRDDLDRMLGRLARRLAPTS